MRFGIDFIDHHLLPASCRYQFPMTDMSRSFLFALKQKNRRHAVSGFYDDWDGVQVFLTCLKPA
jgi:hypothetical protein